MVREMVKLCFPDLRQHMSQGAPEPLMQNYATKTDSRSLPSFFFSSCRRGISFPLFRDCTTTTRLTTFPEEEQTTYQRDNYSLLQRVKEKALKLGLDLQGGMHVTMEVGLTSLLDQLAGDRSVISVFTDVLNIADARARCRGHLRH